jgi:hypothetical protein
MQDPWDMEFYLSPGDSITLLHEFTFDDVSWANQEDIRIAGWVQRPADSGPAEVYQAGLIRWPLPPPPIQCPEDVTLDEQVDVLDLLAVIAAWGNLGGIEDINEDGIVDVLDLLAVISAWGPCVPLGACCYWDGTCSDLPWYDCMIQGNSIWHEGESCDTFACPELPTGACCILDVCEATNTAYECSLIGGDWYEGEDCASYQCQLIYCDASGGCDEYISRVVVGDIDNSSTCTQYGDYTALSTVVQIGQTYQCTVTNGNPIWPTDQFGAWADWNHDADFDDPGETIIASIPGVGPYVFVIVPPAGAVLGNTTMRMRVTYSTTPTPCGGHTYGEVEDYTLIVTE